MLNRVIEKGSVRETHSTCICYMDTQTQFEDLPAMHIACIWSVCTWVMCVRGSNDEVCVYVQIKCAQYWPQQEEREAVFEDTNFRLTLISEDVKSYYTVRQLELENLSVRHLIFLSSRPVVL